MLTQHLRFTCLSLANTHVPHHWQMTECMLVLVLGCCSLQNLRTCGPHITFFVNQNSSSSSYNVCIMGYNVVLAPRWLCDPRGFTLLDDAVVAVGRSIAIHSTMCRVLDGHGRIKRVKLITFIKVVSVPLSFPSSSSHRSSSCSSFLLN